MKRARRTAIGFDSGLSTRGVGVPGSLLETAALPPPKPVGLAFLSRVRPRSVSVAPTSRRFRIVAGLSVSLSVELVCNRLDAEVERELG